MGKKIIRKKSKYNKTEMENAQLEFFRIKEQRKQLEKREAELKGVLDDYITNTAKPDSKGHYLFTTLNEKGEKIHLQKQSRRKITLNIERATKYLTDNGLKHLIYMKDIIPEDVAKEQIIEVLLQHAPHLTTAELSVDESQLEQLVINEEIPVEEFEELCDINQTYAITFIRDDKLEVNE